MKTGKKPTGRKQSNIFMAGDFSLPAAEQVFGVLLEVNQEGILYFTVAHPTTATRSNYLEILRRGGRSQVPIRSIPMHDKHTFGGNYACFVLISSGTGINQVEEELRAELAFAKNGLIIGSGQKFAPTRIVVITPPIPKQKIMAQRSIAHLYSSELGQNPMIHLYPPGT